MAIPFPSAYQTQDPSAYPAPERSPLEPPGDYQRRLRKWRRDNAWRAGQIQALEQVGKQSKPTVPSVTPGKNP